MFQSVIAIPCALSASHSQAENVVQFGHGLFGTRGEVLRPWFAELANQHKWVMIATDWHGMSLYDLLPVVRILVAEIDSFYLAENIVQVRV